MNDQNSRLRFLGKIGRAATGVSPPKRLLVLKKRSCCTLHVAFPAVGYIWVCWLKGSLLGLRWWGRWVSEIAALHCVSFAMTLEGRFCGLRRWSLRVQEIPDQYIRG